MAGLLAGLRVVDLTWGMAGPFAAMLLADNGADVIKVEPPGGDPFRFMPAYHAWNRGKRSLVLDLKSAKGRSQLSDLLATADVLVESFSPGTAERLGIGYADLDARFPRLIVASITGYGSEGPRRDRPGYEHLVDAWLGFGHETPSYRGQPAFNAFPISSYGAAQLATIGILAAVHARFATGLGQHVETSLVEGAFVLNTMQWAWAKTHSTRFLDYTALGASLPRRHLMSMGILTCGDGKEICIHTGPPGKFAAALEILGIADKIPPADPLIEKTLPLTDEERDFLLAEIPKILKTRTRAEWIAAFEKADICCLPVDPPGVVFDDPQAVFDKVVLSLDDPALGPIKMVGPILKCDAAPAAVARPAPRVGEHSQEVLDEIARLPRTPQAPAAHAKGLKHPLQGIRILDFGSYFAGPGASKMLADLGADVVKIEPLQGDPFRGSAAGFRAAQRGKRGIALNTKTSEGQEILRKLVAGADIVTHNMRPGAAERAGIGYEELRQLNPKLIYLHSPGFGSAGPRAHLQAFAPLVSAMAGLQHQTAGAGNPPVPFWISNEDQTSACFGAAWLLMGLHYRNATGRGVQLESSLFKAALMAAGEVILDRDGKTLSRFEIDQRQTGYEALCRMYQASDGWVTVVALLDRDWRALGGVSGLESLRTDPRFSTRALRARNDQPLSDVLAQWFQTRSTDDAIKALDACHVPCELVAPSRVEAWYRDDENLRTGRIATYVHPEAGELREFGAGMRFSKTPALIRGPAPMLGQHTREILSELGYDSAQIEDLRNRKVVAWKSAPSATTTG